MRNERAVNFESCVGLAGQYKLQAVRPNGEVRDLTDWFSNLITDVGLDSVASADWKKTCQIGTGTTAPSVTNTSLATAFASTQSQTAETYESGGSPTYWVQVSTSYTFPVGVFGTFTEVGISRGLHTASPSYLFSRELIRDGAGNPTSITVLSDEYLIVTYRIRLYPPLTDVTGTVNIAGTDYTYILRAQLAGNFYGWFAGLQGTGGAFGYYNRGNGYGMYKAYSGDIGTITGTPSGSVANGSFLVDAPAYINGSYYRRNTYAFDFGVANFGGIKSIAFAADIVQNYVQIGTYQVSFTPVLPKDSTIRLDVTTAIHWARYVP